jgi:hypothetical protein
MLILTIESQPSNALIVDVLPPAEAAKGPKDVGQFSPGLAWVTITSDRIKDYDVYLDGVFYSSDMADEVLDGKASFKIGGDSIHTITVSRKGGPGYTCLSERTRQKLPERLFISAEDMMHKFLSLLLWMSIRCPHVPPSITINKDVNKSEVHFMNPKNFLLCFLIMALLGFASAEDLTGSWSDQTSSDYQTGADTNAFQQVSTPNQQSYSEYAQYFSISSGAPTSGYQASGSGAQSYDITGQEPSSLLVGGQQQKSISYSQMQPYSVFTGGNTLWIQGDTSWTQYAQVPQGASMSLIAITPSGGNANFYEIIPGGQQVNTNNIYCSGYSRIPFYADTVGQRILLFVINSQASNAVIIDVLPYYPGPVYPGPAIGGNAKINIISDWLKGYDVYVDNSNKFTEGEGGIADGKCSFVVTGNTNHNIAIKRGGYYYSQSKYFASGREYRLMI